MRYGNNLPDLRGEFIRGWDNGRGVDNGRGLLSWQEDSFKAHNHALGNRFNKLSARASDIDHQGTSGRSDAVESYTEYRIVNMQPAFWAEATIQTVGGADTKPRNYAYNFICLAG